MSQTAETISVQCACGKKLKAPATAVGRKAKCPACGSVLSIEAPPPPPVEEDDPLGAIYDLAEAEKQAAASNQTDDSPRCPECGSDMGSGTVLCVTCGHDLRSKYKRGAAPPLSSTKPVLNLDHAKNSGKKKDKMAPQGTLIVGVGLSAALAVVAGAIWFFVTWGIGWDIYFLSALIGIGAGVGMQIGQKGFSTAGGLIAAGITMLTIIVCRVAIVFAFLAPALRHTSITADSTDSLLHKYDQQVVDHMIDDNLKAGNQDPDDADDDAVDRARKATLVNLQKMSPDQYQAQVKKVHDEEDTEELASLEADEGMKSIDRTGTNAAQMQQAQEAETAAKQKVAAMSPAQRQAELKRLRGVEAEDEAKAEAAARKAMASSSGTSKAAAIGAAVIVLLIFGIRPIIIMIIAMGIAYRTASGGVSG